MKNKHLYSLLTISVIFVFIMSLFSTVNVLADDSTPPPPTEEPVQPPAEESEPTQVPTQEPPISEPTEVPTQEPSIVEETSVEEILAQVPEGTDVVVLDENGQPQSLSTQVAAEILVTGDPQWCMDGYTPADDPSGLNGYCTEKFSSFNGVGGLIEELTNFTGIYSGSGTIYVAYDYDASTTPASVDTSGIIFDSGDYSLTNLVLQGGWDFNPLSATYNTVVGTTTFALDPGNYLEFWDWGGGGFPGSLTIKDIIIDGGDGLYIGDSTTTTTADVTLNNVHVINTNDGAYIGTEGSVTVTNSDFTSNLENGLVVENMGDITITNVTASGNYDNGAILDNSCGCLMGNIFISSSNFDSNGLTSEGRGLIAHSTGDIALTNVAASGNGGGGAELDNDLSGSGSGDISLTGTNTFNNNGWNLSPSVGLWAVSNGHVSLNGVTASGNGLGFGGGAFVATNGGNISITNSIFSGNCITCVAGFGIVTMNNGGDITLNGVTANGNGNDPINGDLGIGAIIFNTGGNTFVKYSNFSSNCTLGDCFGGGIQVLSFGNVYFDYVTANGNGTATGGGGGANIDSDGNIDIYCSTFNNNTGYGLTVDIPSGNVLTLNGVIFGGNAVGDLDPPISGGTWVINPFDCNPEHTKKKIVDGSSLPLKIVSVSGGQSVELDCEHFGGTKLMLESGNSITLPCPINDSASIIDNNKIEDLPKPLPQGSTFLSAFTTSASKKGEKLDKLGSFATISFVIPEGAEASKLAILFWNGTEWTDVKNTYVRNDPVTGDSYFEAYVKDTGTFVLVQK